MDVMKKMRVAVGILVLAIVAATAAAGTGDIRRAGRRVPGSYICILEDANDPPTTAADDLGKAFGVKTKHVYTTALRGFSFEGSETAAEAISRSKRVKYVEEDPQMTLTVTQSPAPSWGLDRLDQYALPLDNSYTASKDGTGTVIYIIDSGVNPVADLTGRIRASRNWAPGPTGTVNSADTADCYGHGTSVAAIAAGTTYGLAKAATLVNLRVLDCNNSFANGSVVAAAVDWMVNDHLVSHPTEMAAANMSLSTFSGASASIDTAVMNAVQSGITVVVSAGNNTADACTISPARLGNPISYPTSSSASVITVAASSSNDSVAGFSNWGQCVDIHAPGDDVTAMTNTGGIDSFLSGTSFAAPHVTGIAAMHMQRYAAANNPSMIEGVIKDNGIPDKLTNIHAGTPNLLAWISVARRRACCS